MNKNNNKMDLLGNAPVPQALMALGIPIMIGMLINALYNLVDAYFLINPFCCYSCSFQILLSIKNINYSSINYSILRERILL